jgi:hypothetical protein
MKPDEVVFKIADCPVCPGFGPVIVLVSTDERAAFYCPGCGSAWTEVPGAAVDAIATLEDVAPDARVAREEDVKRLGLWERVQPEAYSSWADDLAAMRIVERKP